VIATPILIALAALVVGGPTQSSWAGLPVCGNRTIREAAKRTGCALGDRRCWLRAGGYCTDHVERKIRAAEPARPVEVVSVTPDEVRKGDVAFFLARTHYAYVERVVADGKGRPVAVDLSEFNLGVCWVDEELGVTDRYKVLGRRARVPLRDVDGGFLRPHPVAPEQGSGDP
jgi:hypothetical protein